MLQWLLGTHCNTFRLGIYSKNAFHLALPRPQMFLAWTALMYTHIIHSFVQRPVARFPIVFIMRKLAWPRLGARSCTVLWPASSLYLLYIWQFLFCGGALRFVALRAVCLGTRGTWHVTLRIGAHTFSIGIHLFDIHAMSAIYDVL